MTSQPSRRCAALAVVSLFAWSFCAAEEDIEFVQEHLAEVPMDNRYASLPVWSFTNEATSARSLHLQGAWSYTSSGGLSNEGPLFSASISTPLNGSWRWGAVAFYDPLKLKATSDTRPLQTLFSPHTPIDRPVTARFSNLDGQATYYGAGLFVTHLVEGSWLGEYAWVAGALWQRVTLQDYRLDYEIIEGPLQTLTGQIDFDATYSHFTPVIGLEIPRRFGHWSISTHTLLAWPIPKHGIVGHITGPGFDLRGNTEDVGKGKHFGDPSLTIGFGVLYEPLHLSIDLGAFVTQALLEPHINRGIESNYLLSFTCHY